MRFLLIIVIVLALLAAYFWYATLIKRRNRAQEALSSIDVQLLKRHDLLPNVLKLANQFMAHERDLLNRLTELRTAARQTWDPTQADEVKRHLEAEGALQAQLRRLFAVAENYPELRSSETIVQAQQSFNEVEGHIAAARRFYNAAVTELNSAVQIFPGTVIARMAGVQALPYFELDEPAARKPVDADQYLHVPGGKGGNE
ncbi:MAG: LemA family protein [Ottowia sp.]|nr:LemA family protein [Ottowia sp.]